MKNNKNILLEVASLSMQLSRKYMDDYSHPKSPQKFTQAQLMTCLILKVYLKTTYRGVIEFLDASDKLKKRIGLERLPHYSTLKYFVNRSNVLEIVDSMLMDITQKLGGENEDVAIDSTGLETTSASAHFTSRSGRKRKKYVKISVCVLAGAMLPSNVVVSWGPGNDKTEACPLLVKMRETVQPKQLFADAGYDAEWIHEYCREDWRVKSWIPPAVKRADGKANGKYRSQMTQHKLKKNGYGRRWIVESFMSGLKRTTGSVLNAREKSSMFVEAALKVLAYALRR